MRKLNFILSLALFSQVIYAADTTVHQREFKLSDLPVQYQHASPHSYAAYSKSFTLKLSNNQAVSQDDLNLIETGNSLDFALSEPNYYIVSKPPFTENYVYSRLGMLMLTQNGTVVNNYEFHVINEWDSGDIIMPGIVLPATATTTLRMQGNLDHSSTSETIHSIVYDSLGREIPIILTITPTTTNAYSFVIRSANLTVPEKFAEGFIHFNTRGKLTSAEGLDKVIIPSLDAGSEPVQLHVIFDAFTNYDKVSSHLVFTDGFNAGSLSGVGMLANGEMLAHYNNNISVKFAKVMLAFGYANNLKSYLPYHKVWFDKAYPYTLPSAALGGRFITGYLDKNETD